MAKRRPHRFPVKDLTITIDGKTYRVFNINAYGVGFLIDSPEEIEIGSPMMPITINTPAPVRIAGIPRHVSFYRPQKTSLGFAPGWVCGLEFTTRRDLDGGKLLREYIAECIADSDK